MSLFFKILKNVKKIVKLAKGRFHKKKNKKKWNFPLRGGGRIRIGKFFSKKRINKLGLSWAKLSSNWGLKLEFEVEV